MLVEFFARFGIVNRNLHRRMHIEGCHESQEILTLIPERNVVQLPLVTIESEGRGQAAAKGSGAYNNLIIRWPRV
jgi:hypothetical protein